VSAPLVAFLRGLGHDVLYVAESAPGLRDTDVIEIASIEKRLLLTEDKDFGDLVFRRERKVPGVVLMRIGSENSELKTIQLAAAIARYGEGLLGRYVVIEEGRFPDPSIAEFDVAGRRQIERITRPQALRLVRRCNRQRLRHQPAFCPSSEHLLNCTTDEHSCSTQEHNLANIHGNAHGAPPTGASSVAWV